MKTKKKARKSDYIILHLTATLPPKDQHDARPEIKVNGKKIKQPNHGHYSWGFWVSTISKLADAIIHKQGLNSIYHTQICGAILKASHEKDLNCKIKLKKMP